jgi:glycosyltransferase involved in cell wall biosynthesis
VRILYVCNDLAYFNAHRRWLMDAARNEGADVALACGGVVENAESQPEFTLNIDRFGFRPKSDFAMAQAIRSIVAETRPDVVHLITIKPVLFGALALRSNHSLRRIVATFPGLGRVFDDREQSAKAKLRRNLVIRGLRAGLKPERVRVIVEKAEDRQQILQSRIIHPERVLHIPGSGVNPEEFPRSALPHGRLRVLFAARLLRSKGVMLVAKAAARVAANGMDIEVLIAGLENADDPDALNAAEMAELRANRHITLLGSVAPDKMPRLISSCHAVVLPTLYMEGVPRILIEAAAIGRALIVSDTAGCKALVNSPLSGILLKHVTSEDIAEAFQRIGTDPVLLDQLSVAAHNRFLEGGFSEESVKAATLNAYRYTD